MAKSLEELQAEYKMRSLEKKELLVEEEADEIIEKTRNKPRNIALVSDIIFVFALVLMGACMIINYYGDKRAYTNYIYRFLNDRREMIFIIFAITISLSFFLKFFVPKEGEGIEK
jgi:hypothetical protein